MSNIFLVYDEPITRVALCSALELAGHTVVASTPRSAKEKAQSVSNVDIIIGSAIPDPHATAEVIALHSCAQVIPLGVQTGAWDLRKPFLISDVLAAVGPIHCSSRTPAGSEAVEFTW